MSIQSSLYTAVGGNRNGNGHRNGGGDGHPRRRHGERAVWPDTALSRAFLIALTRWARRTAMMMPPKSCCPRASSPLRNSFMSCALS